MKIVLISRMKTLKNEISNVRFWQILLRVQTDRATLKYLRFFKEELIKFCYSKAHECLRWIFWISSKLTVKLWLMVRRILLAQIVCVNHRPYHLLSIAFWCCSKASAFKSPGQWRLNRMPQPEMLLDDRRHTLSHMLGSALTVKP